MPWFIQFPVCLLAAVLLRGQLLTREVVKKGLEHMYVCICVSVYVYRVHICRREAKLLLSEYIEPQCLYRSRQASNVYAHAELWRRSRTFDTAIPSPPITGRSPQSHSAKESDTDVENTENRIQNTAESSEQSKASAGDVSLILRQSWGRITDQSGG